MPLIICSVAIIALGFLPMNLLLGHAPEFDKAMVATCLSAMRSRIRPPICIAMLVVEESSVFATHALGGPLRRLEIIGKRLAAGEFPGSQRDASAVQVVAQPSAASQWEGPGSG